MIFVRQGRHVSMYGISLVDNGLLRSFLTAVPCKSRGRIGNLRDRFNRKWSIFDSWFRLQKVKSEEPLRRERDLPLARGRTSLT